uniref:Uncharacterized protein n=1 Tax=Anguilla anguilla TaxID=7936 RepID=A0A0E9TMS9_ANGAN
MIWLSALLCTE